MLEILRQLFILVIGDKINIPITIFINRFGVYGDTFEQRE